MAEDTLDTFVAPRYRKQRATPSSKETKARVAKAAEFAADMVIPQTPFDVALTLLPFGKPGKALAAGILAGSPAEAQAGNMSALLKLVAKEAPEQFQSIRNALLRTYHSGLEHSVVGSTRIGGPSEVMQGSTSSVIPNKLDIKAARKNIDKSPLIDFHTHPSQMESIRDFQVRPSDTDLKYWMGQYGSSYTPEIPNEVRLMVGTPANKGERTTGAYNFFATDKPAQTLNPKTYEAAKYELQRSKPLQSIKDNSLVGMYLDSGGNLGDLLDSASPLLLQKYFAQKGLGRHEMQLSNRPVTSPSVTEQELFNQIANPAIEIIKSKRFESFAEGGSVSVYDPDKIDEIMNSLDKPTSYAEGGEVRMGKGGIVKAALEEARDQILKLRALKNENKYLLEDDKELPTRFYRGMAAMVKGGEDSPKDFDELTKQYLSSREPMSEIKSLVAAERPSGALSDQINMRRANAWAASNPLTAASYATTPNSVMVPLQLKDKPSVILDAGGLRWDKYFPQTGRISKSGNYTLNSEFRDALRDPKVKSILLKNIMDSGAGSVDELSRLYGMDITKEDLLSHNLLIKDPSVVRYGISGEVPSLKEPKVKKAQGGSVTAYDPDQVDAIANQYM